MSTPFSEISKLIQNEMQQSPIYTSMDTDIALDYISDLIVTGATVDFSTCKKDLELYTAYNEIPYSNVINIDKTSLDINTQTLGINSKRDIVLYVNDIEINNFTYTYSSDLSVVTITYNFKANDKVNLLFVFEGEFEENLKHREKYIIALASYYHYLCGKIQQEENLIKQLGDKDYKIVRGSIGSDYLKMKNDVWDKLLVYIKKYNDQTSTVEDFM